MIAEQVGNLYIQRYDGMTDMADLLGELPEGSGTASFFKREIEENCGGDRQQPLMDRLRVQLCTTWDDGLAILQTMLDELGEVELPHPVSRRRVSRWADEGDEFSRERAESDFPAWRGTYRANRHGQATATIVMDIGTPWHVETCDILWRGAAGILLALLLEQAGYRVELIGGVHFDKAFAGDSRAILQLAMLKRADEPLDMATLVTAVSGWAFRAAWFSAWAAESEPSNHYGFARNVSDVPEHTPAGAIFAEKLWSRDAAIEWIRKSLATLSA